MTPAPAKPRLPEQDLPKDVLLDLLSAWGAHFALAQGTPTPTVQFAGEGGCRTKRAHAHTQDTFFFKDGRFERTKTGRLRPAHRRGEVCVRESYIRSGLRTAYGLMAHEVAHFSRGKRETRGHGVRFDRQVRALCDTAPLREVL